MPDRQSFGSTLWVTLSLVVLATVLVASFRTAACVTISSRPDCLRHNFALPLGQPTTCLSAALNADAVLQVNDLPAENEEQDRVDVRDEPRLTFLIPSSLCKMSHCQLTAPRSILSLYPLRC